MVDDTPFRFEFTVPDWVKAPEPPSGGKTVVGGEPNPFLERLRGALGGDPRWVDKGVAMVLPHHAHGKPHVVVWVVPAPETDDAAVQAGVDEVMREVIPGVTLVGTERTWR